MQKVLPRNRKNIPFLAQDQRQFIITNAKPVSLPLSLCLRPHHRSTTKPSSRTLLFSSFPRETGVQLNRGQCANMLWVNLLKHWLATTLKPLTVEVKDSAVEPCVFMRILLWHLPPIRVMMKTKHIPSQPWLCLAATYEELKALPQNQVKSTEAPPCNHRT